MPQIECIPLLTAKTPRGREGNRLMSKTNDEIEPIAAKVSPSRRATSTRPATRNEGCDDASAFPLCFCAFAVRSS